MSATVMVTYHSRLGGNYVAQCPDCGTVCAYWDSDDLDSDGRLMCWHGEGE